MRAPPSIDMLQIVIRSSIDIRSMASPPYSYAKPAPALMPSRPTIVRMTSFAYTPAASAPFTSIRRTFSGDIASDCDASTSRTCDVPMPNASAPNAPCVDV